MAFIRESSIFFRSIHWNSTKGNFCLSFDSKMLGFRHPIVTLTPRSHTIAVTRNGSVRTVVGQPKRYINTGEILQLFFRTQFLWQKPTFFTLLMKLFRHLFTRNRKGNDVCRSIFSGESARQHYRRMAIIAKCSGGFLISDNLCATVWTVVEFCTVFKVADICCSFGILVCGLFRLI